jgi:hypothetical protein
MRRGLALLGLVLLLSCSVVTGFDGFAGSAADAGADATADAGGDANASTDAGVSPSADATLEASTDASASGDANAQLGFYAATILADHPVAYFRLDEDAGPAIDRSPTSLQGTYGDLVVRGVPGLLRGDLDNAAYFSGTDAGLTHAGVVVPRSLALEPSSALTVEAWVKLDAVTPETSEFASYGSDLAPPFQPWVLQMQNGHAELYLANNAFLMGGTVLTAGTVYHLVGVFDGAAQVATVYVNGTADVQQTEAGSTLGNYSTYGLGLGCPQSGAPVFEGILDEVAIYDHALTLDRIQAHYTAGTTVH